jgi:biopolymer transport protein ExbB
MAHAAGDLKPYIESVEQAKEGMTLWQLIKSGGIIMIVLALLSIAATTLIIYDFGTLKAPRLCPKESTQKLIEKLELKQEQDARKICESEQNIITSITLAGLDNKKRGKVFAREAMENRTRREVGGLWQNISYLADIAAVSPLIGLLGTVMGMIQAFNVIAFQTAVVKPIVLAGGVSKAMVTTAGGLIIAIPVMLFYAYFRNKVRLIANLVENYSTDIIKTMEKF